MNRLNSEAVIAEALGQIAAHRSSRLADLMAIVAIRSGRLAVSNCNHQLEEFHRQLPNHEILEVTGSHIV